VSWTGGSYLRLVKGVTKEQALLQLTSADEGAGFGELLKELGLYSNITRWK
jgi:hypothetical protein